MNIYIYAKNTEDVSFFDDTISNIRTSSDELYISIENKRSFRELESIKSLCSKEDVIIISNLSSLGTNEADISNQLNWYIHNSIKLVICNIPSTYEYGVIQPMNKAILTTLLQSILNTNKNIVNMPKNKKSNAGRNRMEFPENWDELYDKWEKKVITSKEFLIMTGLKKATFYNLITEYKELKLINEQYIKKYKIV